MPDWLKTALRREENVEDSSENTNFEGKQFPLTAFSDEESIMFPSVSQQPPQGMQSMPPEFNDTFNTYGNRRSRSNRNANYFNEKIAEINDGRHQRNHHRRGHRSHHKGKHRTNHIPQRHIDGAYGDYIRDMMGNDQVVIRNGSLHNTFPQNSAANRQMENPVMEKYFNDL